MASSPIRNLKKNGSSAKTNSSKKSDCNKPHPNSIKLLTWKLREGSEGENSQQNIKKKKPCNYIYLHHTRSDLANLLQKKKPSHRDKLN
jgi:hypothetical protein